MKLASIATVAALLALAPSAAAQAPPPPTPPPAPAAVHIHVASGQRLGRSVFVVAREPIVVEGALTPYVAGERVRVELRRGKQLSGWTTAVVRAHGASGTFRVTLRPRRPGNYRVVAIHRATAAQAAGRSRYSSFGAISGSAHRGARGVGVRLLRRSLARLGYATAEGDVFDDTTTSALIAFRSVNGMSRAGIADQRVFAMLFRGEGAFKLRYPGAGRHVEFDFSRQALALADHGRAEHVYRTSSGKPSTPTVFGTFRFYMKTPGTNSEGMYDSNYFIGGYAIHGYPSVPTYPASHGCIRVPNSNAPEIYRLITIGEQIFVYR